VSEFGCSSVPVVLDKLNVSSLVKKKCFVAIEKYRKCRIEQKMAKDFDQLLEDIKEMMMKLGAQEIQVRNHCEYIVSNIIELKCPRCGQTFNDFEGCFALTYSRQSCGAAFCRLCLEDCRQDAHRHVASCNKYGRVSFVVFGTQADFGRGTKESTGGIDERVLGNQSWN